MSRRSASAVKKSRVTASKPSEPLYVTVADEIAARIRGGQLAVGDRVPSVRSLSLQRRLSPTTALAALRHLESAGYIEARPQSGYYVRQRASSLEAIDASRTARRPRQVSVNDLFSHLISAAANADIVPLGSAVPEAGWFPAQGLQRSLSNVIRQRPSLLTEYGNAFGLVELRRAIARMYADMGCSVNPDDIVITNGCTEALHLVLRDVAKPGDVIAVESPTYFGFLQLIESLGMRAIEIATDPIEGLSVDALRKVLEGGASVRAVLLCPTVSNPLGAVMPMERKRQLLELCEQHRITIIEDDVYGDLHFSALRPLPIKALDQRGNVMLCSSFAKTLAPGMQVGWIVGGANVEALRMAKYVTSVGTPAALQAGIADFLSRHGYQRHVQGLRRACEQQVGRVAEAVERFFPAGTRLSRPQGGFVLWVQLPRGVDVLALHDRALAKGISFAPGPLFSASGQFKTTLRLNCGRDMSSTLR